MTGIMLIGLFQMAYFCQQRSNFQNPLQPPKTVIPSGEKTSDIRLQDMGISDAGHKTILEEKSR